MLCQLELRSFKCFASLHLPLSSLTLLSGTNASGKSSILQSLALLQQTMRENGRSTRLKLNGQVCKLGTVTDVVDQEHGRGGFGIGVHDESSTCRWLFSGARNEMSLAVKAVEVRGKTTSDPESLHNLLPSDVSREAVSLAERLKGLTYITAEREGPREVYPLKDQEAVSTIGPKGSNAVSVLFRLQDLRIPEPLLLPNAPPTLLRQVEARLSTFFPSCLIEVRQVSNANAVVLGVRTSTNTGFLRPIHSGFGITQVLPIVVAILTGKEGSIFLIENPEVHLHPAGQSTMGQFLAHAASAGFQTIVETHSDHVLNGIRRAVKAGSIPAAQVVIHFFKKRDQVGTQVLSPILDRFGNIDVWPENFFDQFDRDMNYFAGWGE